MKTAVKILLLLTIAMSALSCSRMAQQRVTVESVDSVERLGWSGTEIALTVRNGLLRDIRLDSCRMTIRTASGTVVGAELRGGAAIGKQTTQQVRLRFKITAENPSAMQSLWHRLSSGEVQDVTVETHAAAEIGRSRRKIYRPARSLSEILRNFEVSEDDFSTWFQ